MPREMQDLLNHTADFMALELSIQDSKPLVLLPNNVVLLGGEM